LDYGYEEVEDSHVFLDLLRRMMEKINELVMECIDNPSNDLLAEINETRDACIFLCNYVKTKYCEPS
jgi:hypothetical protein